MKQTVFENAQELDNLKSSKILKACTTQWLIHGDTSGRVIHCFKQMMLLLLADVLVLINNFFHFLQTRNLNYSLIISKFHQVTSKLQKIKNNLQNHDVIDASLKQFKLATDFFKVLLICYVKCQKP